MFSCSFFLSSFLLLSLPMKPETQPKPSLFPPHDRLPLQDITHIVNAPLQRRVSAPLPRLRPRSFLDENVSFSFLCFCYVCVFMRYTSVQDAQNPRPIKRRVSEHSVGPHRLTVDSPSLSSTGSLRAPPPLRRSVSATNVSDRRRDCRSSFFADLQQHHYKRSSNKSKNPIITTPSFDPPTIHLVPPQA